MLCRYLESLPPPFFYGSSIASIPTFADFSTKHKKCAVILCLDSLPKLLLETTMENSAIFSPMRFQFSALLRMFLFNSFFSAFQ